MSKKIFLIVMVLTGIVLLYPLSNFQPLLSPGDHGRDLYSFAETQKGAMPYQDYWWVYGPLMPYFYALIFGLFGISIKSILLGKLFLQLVCGIIFYLTASLWMSSLMAFVVTLWFWTFHPDFFFTYNHIGGTAALLGVIYCLSLYIKNSSHRSIYFGFIYIFLLSLIKLNIGLSTLCALILSILIADTVNKNISKEKIYFYLKGSFSVLFLIALVYFIFLKNLPFYYLRQCFPYFKADHQYYASMLQALKMYTNIIFSRIALSWPNLFFGAIIIFSGIQTIYILVQNKSDKKEKNYFLLLIISFVIFSILNLHEFLNSGVFYRTIWIEAFKILIIFALIYKATERFPKILRFVLNFTLALMIVLQINSTNESMARKKDTLHYLGFKNAQVFVGNSPVWIETVKNTTKYLEDHLKAQETFFALPYDPLYYFLAERTSPTRYLIFFDHINVGPEQEKEIIGQLEHKKINYILLSSRVKATERGLGTFGQTYCPLLAGYINTNFEVVATFGDWKNDPGWAWNHGTKILKRIHQR